MPIAIHCLMRLCSSLSRALFHVIPHCAASAHGVRYSSILPVLGPANLLTACRRPTQVPGADAMTTYEWDDVMYVSGLQGRQDLNNRAARVCKPAPRGDGRIGVEMFIGQERVWIKPANLTPIPNVEAMFNPPFNGMSSTETTDVGMFFFANEGSTRIPGFPGRMMTTRREPPAPAPAPAPEADEEYVRSAGTRAPAYCSHTI